jgi:hypothetical protein
MARRGFLSRFADFLRDLVTDTGTPRRRASREETRRFARGQQTSARAAEQYARDRRDAAATAAARRSRSARERRERDPYREIWREEKQGRRGSYERHRELFNTIPGMEYEDDETRQELWASYVRNMVNGRQRRNDPYNPWWGDIGIDPRDFDWDDWREAMGY